MGIKIDFVKETDEEYEEVKKLIPDASKYAYMKADHLIVVPLFQVVDIINKYEKIVQLVNNWDNGNAISFDTLVQIRRVINDG